MLCAPPATYYTADCAICASAELILHAQVHARNNFMWATWTWSIYDVRDSSTYLRPRIFVIAGRRSFCSFCLRVILRSKKEGQFADKKSEPRRPKIRRAYSSIYVFIAWSANRSRTWKQKKASLPACCVAMHCEVCIYIPLVYLVHTFFCLFIPHMPCTVTTCGTGKGQGTCGDLLWPVTYVVFVRAGLS